MREWWRQYWHMTSIAAMLVILVVVTNLPDKEQGAVVWQPIGGTLHPVDTVDIYVNGQLSIKGLRITYKPIIRLQDTDTNRDYDGLDSSVVSVSCAYGDTMYWHMGWARVDR